MLENKLWNRLKPFFHIYGSADRIENTLGGGTWDIFYNVSGVGGWIETKIEKSGKLYFEKFQPNWGSRHYRAGLSQLYVITGGKDDKAVVAYHIGKIIQAPKYFEKDKTVVLVDDLVPDLYLERPYDWEALRLLLTC